MHTAYTANQIHNVVGFDQVSKRNGVFKVFQGYYYTHGRNEDMLYENVSQRLTEAGIKHKMLDCGNHYTAFRGGDSLSKSSHWWATFTVVDE